MWGAGSVVDARAQVITAAGAGSTAAFAINLDLVQEDVAGAISGGSAPRQPPAARNLTSMRATTRNRYGDPADILTVAEVEEPTIGDGDVLIEVEAASVNPADWHLVRATPAIARLSTGLRRPSFDIPGCDVAGRVIAAGVAVTTVRPGDEVMASSFMAGFGAFAERVAVAEALGRGQAVEHHGDGSGRRPVRRDARHSRPSATTPRSFRVIAVLIIGHRAASAPSPCSSPKRPAPTSPACAAPATSTSWPSLGAARVIDYTTERSPPAAPTTPSSSSPGPARALTCGLAHRSRPPPPTQRRLDNRLDRSCWPHPRRTRALAFVPQTITSFTVRPNSGDLDVLRGHIESGDVRPVVDRSFSLDDIHAAFAHVESGQARGKTVVSITSAVATDDASTARSTSR